MSQAAISSPQALTRSDRAIVHTLTVGILLPLLDTTVVNIALHDIGQLFGASLSQAQWVVTAYTLAAAAVVPASAWAAQRLGPRRLWVSCLCLFLAGAGLSGLAWSLGVLVFARILQGLATGLLLPTMQTLVVREVGQDKAKVALTAMAIPSVVAPILGPLVGGLILKFADWRMVFWLHVPICLLAVYLAMRRLPADGASRRLGFDMAGFLLLCPGMIFAVYGMSSLDASGPLMVSGLGMAAAGVVLMGAFVMHARRKESDALVDMALFRYPNFGASSSLLLLSSIVYYGGILLLPLYFIQAGGYRPDVAGLLLALHGAGTLAARQRLSALSEKWGDRRVSAGAIVVTLAGSCLLCWPVFLAHPFVLAAGMFLRGAGIGVLTILAMSGAYAGLDRVHVAHASSLTRMLTHLGATIGAAVVAILVHIAPWGSLLLGTPFGGAHLILLMVAVVCLMPAQKLAR